MHIELLSLMIDILLCINVVNCLLQDY